MADRPDPPDETRAIELEVEVPGTPEEVWSAVATGPGLSAWYVPHRVEEREGGEVSLSFGPGMDVTARVLAWDPPRRVVFGGGDGPGLTFEFRVEAGHGGPCVVHLVNAGFGTGEEWDEQYDGMAEGWPIFLANLRLHLGHFVGRPATAMLPTATWAGPRDAAWRRLLDELGLPPAAAVGDRFEVAGAGAPPLAGTVAAARRADLGVVLDAPTPGTAFLAVEGRGDEVRVSIWSYLYGPDAPAIAARDEPRWSAWLATRGVGSTEAR